MDRSNQIGRREFLRYATVGAGFLLAPGIGTMIPGSAFGRSSRQGGQPEPDVEIALKATESESSILAGRPTPVWRFEGKLLRGDAANLQSIENSYLGPVIRVSKGQRIRIHFANDIPEQSIVHWHGLHVPQTMDGHPRFAIPRGRTYVYDFEIRNRAGTYWYHPHPHGRTGPQVYYGMAGLFLVTDEEEKKVALPTGVHDIPLVIQDRTFDAGNRLLYLERGRMMGGMMRRMQGFLGNRILVNGPPDFSLSVATRAYRLRLLNGSNSRIYKLAWNDGTPVTIVGTDGGLLEKPLTRDYVVLGPAQRLDIRVDFSGRAVGSRIVMRSLAFSPRMAGGMMGPMGAGAFLPNGAEFPVMTVRVDRREQETARLPEQLSTVVRHKTQDAVNRNNPRTFQMLMRHMTWTINGRLFEMTGVAEDEVVRLNTLEAWELVNAGGAMGGRGMMMGMGGMMPHPIHLHGQQFQIRERWLDPALADDWATLQEGVIDDGWQDTVMLFPGQRVKILRKFADYEGLFLYHCHNLEHEDMGMMRNFLVRG